MSNHLLFRIYQRVAASTLSQGYYSQTIVLGNHLFHPTYLQLTLKSLKLGALASCYARFKYFTVSSICVYVGRHIASVNNCSLISSRGMMTRHRPSRHYIGSYWLGHSKLSGLSWQHKYELIKLILVRSRSSTQIELVGLSSCIQVCGWSPPA